MHGCALRKMFSHYENFPLDWLEHRGKHCSPWLEAEVSRGFCDLFLCSPMPCPPPWRELPYSSSHGRLPVPWKVTVSARDRGLSSLNAFVQNYFLPPCPHPMGMWHLWRQPAPAGFAQTFWAPVKDHLWQDLRKITKQLSPRTLWGMWKPECGHIGPL